jgi:hypothetical protein
MDHDFEMHILMLCKELIISLTTMKNVSFVEGLKLLLPSTEKIPLPSKSSISILLVKFGGYDSDLTYS